MSVGKTPVLSGWTTRRWLQTGVAVSLVVLTLLGITGAWVLGRTTQLSEQLVDVRSPALTTSIRLESALLNQETGIRGYGLTGVPEFLEPYRQGIAEQDRSVSSLTELLAGDSDGLRDLAAVQEAITAWQEEIARPLAAAPPAQAQELGATRSGPAKARFDELRTAMAAQQEALRTARADARADLFETMRLRNAVFAAISLVILALAVLVFEGLRRGVTTPLGRLAGDARRVAGGEFEHTITPSGPADLRQLGAEIESMRQRLLSELAFTEQARVRLDAQAADLRRSNAELEQFAYVASHDLQEPLRKVSSFTQLLQRRYGSQLDEKADQYIAFAVDGANRMQVLINDLLDFSRVGRVHAKHTPVDLDKVVDQTLASLSVGIEEAGAEITHEPLPTLTADPTQMGMLWQNLIGNAVKFRRPGLPPRIHIGAEREGELWRFTVTDNGIGISAEYAEKVFVIFQRLHTKDAYSGTGIGLAMCKKIVEFHGGHIGIDNGHTDGTRIVFTLADRTETVSDAPAEDEPAAVAPAPERTP
ncbi:CHASE3 domain-containing protein [Streptomyces sp. NPDC047014]|uniref:sensor histidine kinase n=1 Tax=Streptomyces sp. NPDC047014 TaxID=3155736 RepID=UPI0033C29BCA